jgi:hypothetical protein
MTANDNTHQISGRVIDDKSGRGIARLRVEAWDKDLVFDDLVGSDETDAEGRFRIEFSESYYRELFIDRKPDLFFKIFSGDRLIKSTRDSVLWNARAGSPPVEIAVPWTGEQTGDTSDTGNNLPAVDSSYIVEGGVASPDRAGVGGLRVEVLDRNVGQDVLLAETMTDERGRYRVSFESSPQRERAKKQPDLQARVYAGRTFLAASDVRYNATARVTLNVSLPANSAALPSEHETLTAALKSHYDGRLRDLQESGERQDITYLANKTGWDARAVALAALADQFSRHGATDDRGANAIKPSFYYALFRAGLPANPDTLYQADARTVERIWQQAVNQGVIPGATEREVGDAVGAFRRLSAQRLLTGPALAGASSLKEMLDASRLNESQQTKFAELYTTHRSDLPKFWEEVEGEFGAGASQRLQVDGKLAFLTINNAPLMRVLRDDAGGDGLRDTVELARKGLHRAAAWGRFLDDGVAVPEEIPGGTPEAKRANYAEYLAAQVRLSYPTASVAEMVKSGDMAVSEPERVHAFLTEHQGKFEIGMMPVGQYVKRNQLDVAAETLTQVKRVERVYQITPSDRAMNGLMKRGVDSASQVVRFEKAMFVQTFAQDLGGAEIAAQTYDKSLQVHNAVLNIVVSYLTARNGVDLGSRPMQNRRAEQGPELNRDPEGMVLRPRPKARDEADNAGDIIAYPTLEDLFGEMDFCACDHCRSILSPAAYLVDLLLFIDQEPAEPGGENPQAVLLERRPDVEHLPLTCENTNTALPYIDVVNETLEYFIANTVQQLSLDGYVGHDTDGSSSEDLLASPQFVMDSAYTTLRAERFPSPLPFHQPLENLRRYFNKFDVPLPLAMERLRRGDDLERGANAYGWRDILSEELGLSRAEHEILTDSGAAPLSQFYGFTAGTTDAAAVAELSNAKRFTRRLVISYDEIVAILKTRFVNPNSDLLPKLERLGVPFAALQALKDGTLADADFDALLPTGAGVPDPAEYDGDVKAWVRRQENFDRIMRIITLADPTASPDTCNFENLEFRYAKPMAAPGDESTRLGAVEFVRLLRFVRLWKKLGWTIEQTDAAVCALFPVPPFPLGADAVDTDAKLDAGFLTLLPRLGVVASVMKALNLTAKRDLLPLLALWSPLGTHGTVALYRQMFLNPSMLAQDAAFADNGYGEFLRDDTQKLIVHAEALRAAFGLTGDEFTQIVAALGFDADSADVQYNHPLPTLGQAILDAGPGVGYDDINKRLSYTGALDTTTRDALKAVPGVSATFQDAVDALFVANQAALTGLTLDNVSAVFRAGWLARKLKLSVRELLLLTRLTGLDPFAAPDPTNPAALRIIELVQALKGRSLKSAVALYLIWNQDLSGKSAPDPAQVAEFARTLRGDFAAIEDQFAATEDPGGDLARARMALVYGTEAADAFFALLDDTLALDVAYTHPQPTLEAPVSAADAKIAYDDFHHRLSRTGLLNTTTRDALKAIPGVTAAFRSAVDAIFDRSEDARGSFFSRYPELKPLYVAYVASADPPEVKRGALLKAFRPELSRRRKRQQALQRFSAAANTDLTFTQALLDPTPPAPFPLHAEGNALRPALDDVLSMETPGLAAQFFFRDTATGAVNLSVPAAANMDYSVADGNPLPANPAPGDAISAIWSGLVETPEAGFYNFVVETDGGATVTLNLDGQTRTLTQNGKVWRDNDPLELKAGALYTIALTVNKVRDSLSLKWETPKRAREVVAGRYLYQPSLFPPFNAAYIRFLKAASLAQGLRLTAAEISRFATDADYQIGGDGWLNALATTGDPSAPTAAALLKPLRDLLDFSRIKSEVSPADESLLLVLRDPPAAGADGRLYSLGRWDEASLDALLVHFGGGVAGLAHFDQFRRVYDAFGLIQKMGISAAALIKAATNEPTPTTVGDFQAALRARYEAADWRSVVQPINDEMRGLQRDALVAYILHRMRSDIATEHIDTADKLFEYFLMDVQMEPCMQTSRIRHALSSVQLFIERCLMNLEPRATLTANKARQWEWMKRYRVWEANRKVFLFPENWLEPELRDDKSPFFKEVESELLQGDITEDAAAVALLNYLSKLEEVAKLEPCGIHHSPADPQQRTGEVNHVVARTAGASRKYYYRRREYGYWTPWEQIKLDIEENPVIPVVWDGRLLLFWLRVLKQTPVDPNDLPVENVSGASISGLSLAEIQANAKSFAQSNSKVRVQAVLCWSEYYNGKWQPAKTSDISRPEELDTFDAAGDNAFDRSKLRLTAFEAGDALGIRISGQGGGSFFMYNTHSLPLRQGDAFPLLNLSIPRPNRNIGLSGDSLILTYSDGLLHFNPDGVLTGQPIERKVLDSPSADRATESRHTQPDPWDAPFFYEDSRHVFYVTTAEEQVRVASHPGYGSIPGFVEREPHIPSMVFEVEERPGPRFWGDGDPVGPDMGVVNPDPMRRLISEDANIHRGIGSPAAVKFGDALIGPSGAMPAAQQDIRRK